MPLMGRLTAIEFGSDTCVLVKTGIKGGKLRVSAVDMMDPPAFPGVEAFEQALREARRRLRLPRRARVVLWGAPEGAAPSDTFTDPLIRPLQHAGFHVERVVSPCDALAALARLRVPRSDAPVLWLVVNRGGVALVVVRPGALLYARSLPWDSSIGSSGSQARLLQRYSQVAFIAPELRQAVVTVAQNGGKVDTVVTCGNLPDLRSLTMPLIEELDLEVETLDSFDGLVMTPELMDRYADLAPAVRLACAGALARPDRPRYADRRGIGAGAIFRAAALATAALGLGWMWLSSRPAARQVLTPAPVNGPAPVVPDVRHRDIGAPTGVASTGGGPTPQPRPTADSGARRPATAPPPAETTAKAVPSTPGPKPAAAAREPNSRQVPAPRPAAKQPDAPKVKPAPARGVPPPQEAATGSGGARGKAAGTQPVKPQRGRTDKAGSTGAQPRPLLDPLPHVTTILTSEDRRFAMLADGRVVAIGDRVGPRVVIAIEPRLVVLREPSGLELRVGLGGRLLGVGRIVK
jgi:hypothetical protein